MKNSILHAILMNENILLLGSDMVQETGLKRGNSISLMMQCRNEDEIRKHYLELSKGGKQTHAIERTFWGAFLGDLTDKFGNNWILHAPVSDS